MMKKHNLTALAIGSTFAIGATLSTTASAQSNPFSAQPLEHGYQVPAHKLADAECGNKSTEGRCGEEGKGKEASCGEEKGREGQCGAEHGSDKSEEGKCGEGKCGEA